jgi:putative transport protein
MDLFGGVIPVKGITFLMFSLFAVALSGYLLGRVSVKGVSLGTAGVFITALLFGALFGRSLGSAMTVGGADISSNAFKIVETLGLILFVGAVGMIAGPNFFKNLKKNFKSYIFVGFLIILGGALASLACYFAGMTIVKVPEEAAELGIEKNQYMMAMTVGIMSGSLTSTPAFSAAKATAATVVASAEAADAIQDVVTVGHAIAYLFGVIGVVLFVQLVPKFAKADMDREREFITAVDTGEGETAGAKKRLEIDPFGFAAFGLVVIAGIILGAIRVPLSGRGLSGVTFSLTTTGGVLISGLVFSHFGHIGPVSLRVSRQVLEAFREFGLMLFLIGAGVPGGSSFVKYFQPVYFLYGVVITVVPLFVGYFAARRLLRLSLLNSLGSVTGGMTSTPALGTLIRAAGTDDVASSYASTYPIALICVVLASQVLILVFGS